MVLQRILVLCLCLVWAVSAVRAGPWLREEGAGFLSLSGELHDAGRLEGGVYLEYGLRPKLTFGAKVDMRTVAGIPSDGEAQVFLRWPLGARDGPWLMAYDLGLGARRSIEGTDPFARLGFSIGRGLGWGAGGGWLVFDSTVELPFDGPDTLLKFDATLGRNLNDRWKVMVQTFVAISPTDETLTLAPSVIWSPGGSKTSIQLGFEAEGSDISARLGVWRTF